MTNLSLPNIFLFHVPYEDEIGAALGIFTVLFLIYTVIRIIRKMNIKNVHSHWHHMFDTRPFTPLEFYQALLNSILAKGIPNISYDRIMHSEYGLLSAKREYLRITYLEYKVDVCAAPFGKEGFFVSWWLGDSGTPIRDILVAIPKIGKLFEKREKTFFEQDTEIMFKEMTATCVKETIEQMTSEKGVRLTDNIDWKPYDRPFKQV
jgi:hypothetical protein